jgi:hypothetical protein
VYHLNVIDVAGPVFESPATSRRSAPRHHVPKSSGDGPGPEPTVSSRGGSALLPTRPPSMDHVSERDFCHFHMTLKAACDTWSDTDYGSSEKLIAHLSTQESLFELASLGYSSVPSFTMKSDTRQDGHLCFRRRGGNMMVTLREVKGILFSVRGPDT